MASRRIVALTWHQRTSAIGTRELLLSALASGPDRALLATCHRVEVYAAVAGELDIGAWLKDFALGKDERASMTVLEGASALAHLFAVAAGLDSALVGEPQILAQVRRACTMTTHPALVSAFGHALHVGRTVRARAGLASTRSVGSLAVDALLSGLPDARHAALLVIGAGEMGKLALRAVSRRVRSVVIANRDVQRAVALAEAYGARAATLADVPDELMRADAVISAADTRGAVLTAGALERRLRSGSVAVVDIAVPRSVDAAGRALLGRSYHSVDDLPGTGPQVPQATITAALADCEREAVRFCETRSPERSEAIRELRDGAERVRAAKLGLAMRRLGHLSARDRRIVEALSRNLTGALMHTPTVTLRDEGGDARALVERSPR